MYRKEKLMEEAPSWVKIDEAPPRQFPSYTLPQEISVAYSGPFTYCRKQFILKGRNKHKMRELVRSPSKLKMCYLKIMIDQLGLHIIWRRSVFLRNDLCVRSSERLRNNHLSRYRIQPFAQKWWDLGWILPVNWEVCSLSNLFPA